MKFVSLCAIGCLTLFFASPLRADECPGQVFAARPDLTPPNSVANGDLATLVNQDAVWADGIKISVEDHGNELWLDVTDFPGTTVVAASMRVVWLVARLSSGHQSRMVFSDAGAGVFQIDAGIVKDIGCRFVIGQEGGENPIALMREFYDALAYYKTDLRVAPLYNGSLLGDTMTAMTVNNEVFVPKWIVSAVK